jgi:hypothetical protein
MKVKKVKFSIIKLVAGAFRVQRQKKLLKRKRLL